jgi:hypothetical protein
MAREKIVQENVLNAAVVTQQQVDLLRLRNSLLSGAQSQISGLADKRYFAELRSEVMRRLPTRF